MPENKKDVKTFLKQQIVWIIVLVGTILILLFKLYYLKLVHTHKEIHHILNPHLLGIYTALSIIPLFGSVLVILHHWEKYKNSI